ncbi:hypothetical protein FOB41_28690 [Agrobacterium pusense]|uniref:Uncharacterized protein n=1 Tax=Agrobacterium pusense TaxID=648995 RepID=A0A6H0ZYU2_9HYPH|nr:hypothetical protein FOB41_28690 [Agrobacterium pusense]
MKTAKFSPNSLLYRRGMMSLMPKVSGYCERSAPHSGHEFSFVTDYPASRRAFYHIREWVCLEILKGFDLLWLCLEIATGAQRATRIDAGRSGRLV